MAEDMAGAGSAGAGVGPGEPGETGGTGDAQVDEAISRLGDLADAPLEEHPAILEQVHGRLREVLGELNPGPGRAGQP